MTGVLDALMRAVLARLELISTTAAANPGTGHSGAKPESKPPTGSPAPHLHYRHRYAGCRTDHQRRECITDALDELRRLRYSPDRSRVRGTKEWRATIALDERPPTVVATVFDVSRQTVHNYRREFRRAA